MVVYTFPDWILSTLTTNPNFTKTAVTKQLLAQHGIKIFQKHKNDLLNETKCLHEGQVVYFLGHTLTDMGIVADQKMIKTILEFRAPTTTEETRSFLDLVTYLGKFITDLGTLTDLLRQLIRKYENSSGQKLIKDILKS